MRLTNVLYRNQFDFLICGMSTNGASRQNEHRGKGRVFMQYALDIDQLRSFLAIAELGSFTRAAEAVNKTQSAVSMQMRRLEERIGQPIFERDGRQSRLTESGKRLVDYAYRLIRLNDEALCAFADPISISQIRFGLPDDYADRLLPQVLAGFARVNPSIEVMVRCDGSVRVGELIAKGELDLGIVTTCDVMRQNPYVFRREPLFWVGAADRILDLNRPLSLAVGPQTCSWRRQAEEALERAGIAYRISYSSVSATALSGAVLAGLAVTMLPESALRSGMRILDEREGLPGLPDCEIGIIRSVQADDPVFQRLFDHIVASIGNVDMAAA